MIIATLPLVLLLNFVVTFAAGAKVQLLGRAAHYQILSARQDANSTDIGEQCKSQCSQPINTFSGCVNSTDTKCMCSEQNERDLINCFNCLMPAAGGTDAQTWQLSVDDYINTCAANGVRLPTAAVSGAESHASPSSVANSNNGVASVTINMGVMGFMLAVAAVAL